MASFHLQTKKNSSSQFCQLKFFFAGKLLQMFVVLEMREQKVEFEMQTRRNALFTSV